MPTSLNKICTRIFNISSNKYNSVYLTLKFVKFEGYYAYQVIKGQANNRIISYFR